MTTPTFSGRSRGEPEGRHRATRRALNMRSVDHSPSAGWLRRASGVHVAEERLIAWTHRFFSLLRIGGQGIFPLPAGPLRPGQAPSVVFMPDGSVVGATRVYIRRNKNGVNFHAYPVP